jgi:hypothetical protein
VAQFGAVMEQQTQANMNPGAYSIPVKIQAGVVKDPTLSGYESPSFIHKKETNMSANNAMTGDPSNNIEEVMKEDIQTFINQFDNIKDKKDRVEVCK